jgi:hypothetical protein
MFIVRRRLVGLVAGAVLAGCLGCGGGAPPASSSTQEAEVSGTVTIRGKPATVGEITFDPSNVYRRGAGLASAKVGPDGRYSLKTLVGENAVRVRGPQVDKDPTLDTNQLNVVIKAGTNAVPVDVK